jgi:hypothetical protein
MSLASSIRSTVRNIITQLGSSATVYSFSSATKTTNDEGDVSVSNWGSGTSIKIISANNYKLRRVLSMQGEENNQSDRVLLIRDDATVAVKDKVTIGTDDYEVDEIKVIDPVENLTLAKRIVLSLNVNY